MKDNKILFLFTTGYPFGIIEDFLHNEVIILSKSFQKVIIFVPVHASVFPIRLLPKNIEIHLVENKGKIKALFIKNFWKAYFLDIKEKQTQLLKLREFKNALSFYSKSLDIAKIADNELKNYSIKEIALYSYWLNESALAIAQIKIKYGQITAISRAHGWDLYKERHSPAYLPFRNWISENLDQICCVSNFGKNYIKRTYAIALNKYSTKYLGTLPINCPEFKNKQSLKIISCSNVIQLKRIQLIVDVLAQLTIPIHWVHIGDGAMINEIKQQARENLKSNISFDFKGEISNLKVRTLYENESFDLFISLSESEGIPVSMMEALSVGVPIIATDVGGVGEIVIENKTGWLIPEDDLVKKTIISILNYSEMSSQEIQYLKQNCVTHWVENFNAVLNYNLFSKEVLFGSSVE